MPHLGQLPGLSDTTSGCMGHVYVIAAAGLVAGAFMPIVSLPFMFLLSVPFLCAQPVSKIARNDAMRSLVVMDGVLILRMFVRAYGQLEVRHLTRRRLGS